MTKYQAFRRSRFKLIIFITVLSYCCGSPDNYQELSGDYFFMGGDGNGIISHKPNSRNIYGNVIQYKFNDQFIIAIQKPDRNNFKNMISSEILSDVNRYPNHTSDDINKSDILADSLLKFDPYYVKIFSRDRNYYIISHKINKVFGPMTKGQYQQLRLEIRVPDELRFEEN